MDGSSRQGSRTVSDLSVGPTPPAAPRTDNLVVPAIFTHGRRQLVPVIPAPDRPQQLAVTHRAAN